VRQARDGGAAWAAASGRGRLDDDQYFIGKKARKMAER